MRQNKVFSNNIWDGSISLSNKLNLEFEQIEKLKNIARHNYLLTKSLRLQFLSNLETVTIRNSQDLIQACYLTRSEVLITVDNQNNTFKTTLPHLPSVILRYVLSEYCSSNEISKYYNQSVDLFNAIRDAVASKYQVAESGYEGKWIAHVYRQSKTTPQTAIVVCK
ncbi:17297_t:CDS:2, partial [Funneliformis caledonium]